MREVNAYLKGNQSASSLASQIHHILKDRTPFADLLMMNQILVTLELLKPQLKTGTVAEYVQRVYDVLVFVLVETGVICVIQSLEVVVKMRNTGLCQLLLYTCEQFVRKEEQEREARLRGAEGSTIDGSQERRTEDDFTSNHLTIWTSLVNKLKPKMCRAFVREMARVMGRDPLMIECGDVWLSGSAGEVRERLKHILWQKYIRDGYNASRTMLENINHSFSKQLADGLELLEKSLTAKQNLKESDFTSFKQQLADDLGKISPAQLNKLYEELIRIDVVRRQVYKPERDALRSYICRAVSGQAMRKGCYPLVDDLSFLKVPIALKKAITDRTINLMQYGYERADLKLDLTTFERVVNECAERILNTCTEALIRKAIERCLVYEYVSVDDLRRAKSPMSVLTPICVSKCFEHSATLMRKPELIEEYVQDIVNALTGDEEDDETMWQVVMGRIKKCLASKPQVMNRVLRKVTAVGKRVTTVAASQKPKAPMQSVQSIMTNVNKLQTIETYLYQAKEENRVEALTEIVQECEIKLPVVVVQWLTKPNVAIPLQASTEPEAEMVNLFFAGSETDESAGTSITPSGGDEGDSYDIGKLSPEAAKTVGDGWEEGVLLREAAGSGELPEKAETESDEGVREEGKVEFPIDFQVATQDAKRQGKIKWAKIAAKVTVDDREIGPMHMKDMDLLSAYIPHKRGDYVMSLMKYKVEQMMSKPDEPEDDGKPGAIEAKDQFVLKSARRKKRVSSVRERPTLISFSSMRESEYISYDEKSDIFVDDRVEVREQKLSKRISPSPSKIDHFGLPFTPSTSVRLSPDSRISNVTQTAEVNVIADEIQVQLKRLQVLKRQEPRGDFKMAQTIARPLKFDAARSERAALDAMYARRASEHQSTFLQLTVNLMELMNILEKHLAGTLLYQEVEANARQVITGIPDDVPVSKWLSSSESVYEIPLHMIAAIKENSNDERVTRDLEKLISRVIKRDPEFQKTKKNVAKLQIRAARTCDRCLRALTDRDLMVIAGYIRLESKATVEKAAVSRQSSQRLGIEIISFLLRQIMSGNVYDKLTELYLKYNCILFSELMQCLSDGEREFQQKFKYSFHDLRRLSDSEESTTSIKNS